MSISTTKHPFATTAYSLSSAHAVRLKEEDHKNINDLLGRPLGEWSFAEADNFQKKISPTLLTLYLNTPRQVEELVLTPIQDLLTHFERKQKPILDFICQCYQRELHRIATDKHLFQGTPLVERMATSLKNDGSILEYAPDLVAIFSKTMLPIGLTFQQGIDFYAETQFIKRFKLLMTAREAEHEPFLIPSNSDYLSDEVLPPSPDLGQKRSASPPEIEEQPPLQRVRVDNRESSNSLQEIDLASELLEQEISICSLLMPQVKDHVNSYLPNFSGKTAGELVQYALRMGCKEIFEDRAYSKLNLLAELIILANSFEEKWELLNEVKGFGKDYLFAFLCSNKKFGMTGLLGFIEGLLAHPHRDPPTDADYKFLIHLHEQYPALYLQLWKDYCEGPKAFLQRVVEKKKRKTEFDYLMSVLEASALKRINPDYDGIGRVFNRPEEFLIMSEATQEMLKELEAFGKTSHLML